jgi:hypothetical protein
MLTLFLVRAPCQQPHLFGHLSLPEQPRTRPRFSRCVGNRDDNMECPNLLPGSHSPYPESAVPAIRREEAHAKVSTHTRSIYIFG